MFSNKRLRNIKKIKLNVPSQKFLDKSINMAPYESQVTLQGIQIAQNPYTTFSIARIIKRNDNNNKW